MPKPDAQPWMPVYWADLLSDTAHLSAEEFGGYLRLIGAYWRHRRPLRDDDGQLARIAGIPARRWRSIRPTIADLFQVTDGLWRHRRVDEELEKAQTRRDGYSQRGVAGAAARWWKEKPDGPDVDVSSTTSPTQAEQAAFELDGGPGADDVQRAFDIYNDLAVRQGLPKAEALDRRRRASLRKRLSECGGIQGWRVALEVVESTPFLLGKNDRKWKAGLDFLLQPSSFTRVREGYYSRSASSRPVARGPDELRDAVQRLQEHVSKKGGKEP